MGFRDKGPPTLGGVLDGFSNGEGENPLLFSLTAQKCGGGVGGGGGGGRGGIPCPARALEVDAPRNLALLHQLISLREVLTRRF